MTGCRCSARSFRPGLDEVQDHRRPARELLATSFHPEVTDDLRIHRYFVDLVRAAQ